MVAIVGKIFQVKSIVSVNKIGTFTFIELSLLVSKEPTPSFSKQFRYFYFTLIASSFTFLTKRQNIVMF
jgi:hypothetical protein